MDIFYELLIIAGISAISSCIGIFFIKKISGKTIAVKNFLSSISLLTSHITTLNIIAEPTELYLYGAQIFYCVFMYIFSMLVAVYIILPVFYNLKIKSLYEYIEQRFNKRVKNMMLWQYVLPMFVFIPLFLYIPSLVVNQVFNISINWSIFILGLLSIFSTLKGLKSIIIVDTFNGVFVLMSFLVILAAGIVKIGGLEKLVNIIVNSDRMKITLDPSPFLRIPFIPYLIHSFINGIEHVSFDPSSIEKINSISTLKKARIALFIFFGGMIFFKLLSFLFGFIIYSSFRYCDPVISGQLSSYRFIVPFYVQSVISSVPGIMSLFIITLVLLTLSFSATKLNNITEILFENFVKSEINKIFHNKILNALIVLSGLLCIMIGIAMVKITNIFQIVMSFGGLLSGINFAIFSCGLFSKSINSSNIFVASNASFIILFCMVIGNYNLISTGGILYKTKSLSCDNVTLVDNSFIRFNDDILLKDLSVNKFFLVSFVYYNILGVLITSALAIGLNFIHKSPKIVNKNLLVKFSNTLSEIPLTN